MIATIFVRSDLSVSYDGATGEYLLSVRSPSGWGLKRIGIAEFYEMCEAVLRVRDAGIKEVEDVR